MPEAAPTATRTTPHWWNVPNQLTSLRLLLALVVFGLIPLKLYFVSLVIFVIAASTDWFDGYWARKYGQVTKLGRILDPFVDKFIICGIFIYLAAIPESKIAPWMAVLVTARELLVTALRGQVEGQGGDFSAKWSGKLKMLFQCLAASLALYTLSAAFGPPWQLTHWTCFGVIWLAVLTTVHSGLVYVIAAISALREPLPAESK